MEGGLSSLIISRNSNDKGNMVNDASKELLPPRLENHVLDIVTSPIDSQEASRKEDDEGKSHIEKLHEASSMQT